MLLVASRLSGHDTFCLYFFRFVMFALDHLHLIVHGLRAYVRCAFLISVHRVTEIYMCCGCGTSCNVCFKDQELARASVVLDIDRFTYPFYQTTHTVGD